MGRYLMGRYLMGRYLIGRYLMGRYKLVIQLSLSRECFLNQNFETNHFY